MNRKALSTFGAAALAAAAGAVCHAAASPAASAPSSEAQSWEAKCVRLEGRTLGRVVIADAEFVAPGTAIPTLPLATTEAFCRVDATASTSAGTEIKIAVSLPAKWNGKLAGVGGAGFEGGYIFSPVMLPLLSARGFAAVATNAGHAPSEIPAWALEQPERIVDYGHRANHLGAVFAKALVADHYGRTVESALFHGCSNGGRDALMLAQRHPEDYDAIAAGAPANDYSGLMSSFARIGQLVQTLGGEFSAAKLKLLNDAVIKQCDTPMT